MTITTKFDLGQEVFFLDTRCAGCTPGKGEIISISFEQKKSGEPILIYTVKVEEWFEEPSFMEISLFASLSEFKETMIRLIDESCKNLEEGSK